MYHLREGMGAAFTEAASQTIIQLTSGKRRYNPVTLLTIANKPTATKDDYIAMFGQTNGVKKYEDDIRDAGAVRMQFAEFLIED